MPQARSQVETVELVHRRAYPKRPQPTVASAFRQHVNRTGRPETFPTISTATPPPDTKVVVLSEIHIVKAVRGDDTYAPCPICNGEGSQFLHGYLVWCEEAEAIYAIGQECAGGLWEAGLLDRAVAAYKQQEREVALELVLLDALPRIKQMSEWADAHRAAAEDADRLSRSFRQTLAGHLTQLDGVIKTGGFLYGADGEGGAGVLGRLAGGEFCLGSSHAVRDLNTAKQYLAPVAFGSDEEVVEKLAAMSLKEKQAASYAAAHAYGLLLKVSGRIAAAWAFTQPDNLALLHRWGGQQRDRLSALGNGRSVRVEVGGKVWFEKVEGLFRPASVPSLRGE